MEASPIFESSTNAIPSPNGQYIASVTSGYLYIQYAYSLETAFTFPLDSALTSATTRSTTALDNSIIQWSHTSHHILLISTQGLMIFSLSDTERKVRISNGSAGLGRILAAEMVGLDRGGEQVLVLWEFGRMAVWDLQTGRAAEELGDIKSGTGRLSSAWGIRREEGKAEVLALLGRTGAQDTLSLFLPPSTTPFKTITLPTTDAQSIAWSGTWLSVLDSPLASPAAPALYVYTPDGNLFRSYSSSLTAESLLSGEVEDPASEAHLGPRSLAWSKDHFALASSTSPRITLLSTRTFTPTMTLDPSTAPPNFCHQESLSAQSRGSRRGRTYNLLASNSIPQPPGGPGALGAAVEMKWSLYGRWLSVRYERLPSAIFIWRVPAPQPALARAIRGGKSSSGKEGKEEEEEGGQEAARIDAPPPVMLHNHSSVKKLVWHPARESLLTIIGDDADEKNPSGEAGGVYFFDAGIDQPPLLVEHAFGDASDARARVQVQWLPAPHSAVAGERARALAEAEPLKLLVSSRRRGWFLVYPEGAPSSSSSQSSSRQQQQQQQQRGIGKDNGSDTGLVGNTLPPKQKQEKQTIAGAKDGDDDDDDGDDDADSLYDILTGRTPLPELGSQQSRDRDDSATGPGLQDTFREKRLKRQKVEDGGGDGDGDEGRRGEDAGVADVAEAESNGNVNMEEARGGGGGGEGGEGGADGDRGAADWTWDSEVF